MLRLLLFLKSLHVVDNAAELSQAHAGSGSSLLPAAARPLRRCDCLLGASMKLTGPSETATLFHHHVFMMSQDQLSVLVVQHAQRTHLCGRAAGGRSSAGMVVLQQTLEEEQMKSSVTLTSFLDILN